MDEINYETTDSRIARKISKLLDMPEDVITKDPRCTLSGDKRFVVENHNGITLYTNRKIIIETSILPVCVIGSHLRIKNISHSEIAIEGRIRSFEYLQKEVKD